MSDNRQTSSGDPQGDRREQRRLEREERRRLRGDHHGWGGPWIGGVILVVLGVIFLLQNFGMEFPRNWWAFFVLIPAAASFVTAWQVYERRGEWSYAVVGPMIAGLILVAVFAALYYELDWGRFWPVILIIVGLGLLSRSFWSR
jgi:hypothetical protein